MGEDGTEEAEDEASFRARWDPGDPDTLTGAIVGTVAEARGVDEMALSELLSDVLDPDALARVLASGSGPVTVTFTLDHHSVRVSGDGEIVVEPEA